MEKLWSWITEKLAPYLVLELQIGGHCGFCGKWVPNVIVETRWGWTICEKCLKKYEGKKI